MKKYIRSWAVIAAAMLTILTTAAAHSGRTDASGGHYNRSTGEYHYHHGRAAHQHPDGICPYVQGTVKPTAEMPENVIGSVSPSPGATHKYNYSSSSIRAPSHSSIPSSDSASTNTTKSADNTGGILSCIFILGPLILYLIYCIIKWIGKKIKAWKEKRRRAKLPPYIKPEILIKSLYTKPKLEIKSAPERWNNIAIGEDRYPYDITVPLGYVSQFTVFTTKRGKSYHNYYCPHLYRASYAKSRHLYWALSNGYKPCSQCKPPSTVDPWYIELFPERTALRKYIRQDTPKDLQNNHE